MASVLSEPNTAYFGGGNAFGVTVGSNLEGLESESYDVKTNQNTQYRNLILSRQTRKFRIGTLSCDCESCHKLSVGIEYARTNVPKRLVSAFDYVPPYSIK